MSSPSPPRILSLSILRIEPSGLPSLVSSTRIPSSSSSFSSSSALDSVPSDEQITNLVRQRVRLHFNNTGRIELDNIALVYRVSVSDPLSLCLLVSSDPSLPFPTALDFLGTIVSAIEGDHQWVSSLRNGVPVHDSMFPTLLQFIMTENAKNPSQTAKMSNLQKQVEDVKQVMANNVELIMERGERLEDIEQRSGNLAASSESFKMTARRVQKKFCMLNAKWTIIAGTGIVLLVVVIILIILSACGVFNKH